MMTELVISSQGVERLRARNPWVLAKDVLRTVGKAPKGATVTLMTEDGEGLAKASVSPESKIRARVWHWNPDAPVDHAWFKTQIHAANERRLSLGYGAGDASAYRMVASEGDGLPGVTIDRYGSTLVVQLTTAGADKWREAIVDAATAATGASHVYERSDAAVRELEGLERVSGCLAGDEAIGNRDIPLTINESSAKFLVDVKTGHKTGFYLDQATNRSLVAGLSDGKSVLNCFSYTGGFGIAAAYGGATFVVNVDSSAPALELGQRSVEGSPEVARRIEWLRSDVKKALQGFEEQGQKFDVIVMDPPKLAPSRQSARKALGVYGDLNRRAMALLNPGGFLATFSCSGAVSEIEFAQMLVQAGEKASASMSILRTLGAGPDHPALLGLSTGGYLKGKLLQKLA